MRKWWPGLIPLALILAFAAYSHTSRLEADLAARADAALADITLDEQDIRASGRDIELSAKAFTEQGRRGALAIAETVRGVRRVNDQTVLLPWTSPFTWSARREVTRIVLGGEVPLPETRTSLNDIARRSGGSIEVVDQMRYSRGAPANFDAATRLLAGELARLSSGEIKLADTKATLNGMARELGDRELIMLALRDLPAGFTTEVNIQAPPYVFQANKDPVTSIVTFSGYAPDNVRRQIVTAAGRKFFSDIIIDGLRVALGAPAGFANAVTVALGDLSRLSTGSLVIADRTVKLTGDAFYEAAATQIRDTLQSRLPEGWQAETEISVKPLAGAVDSAVCQRLFSDLLARGRIRFESGSATIDPDSASLLDQLVAIAMRCPTTLVEIAGHTDADGDDAANLSLSQRRARAVVDYMTVAGLSGERLMAVGYGRTQPIASNDTEEGKTQNRRIEFTVR